MTKKCHVLWNCCICIQIIVGTDGAGLQGGLQNLFLSICTATVLFYIFQSHCWVHILSIIRINFPFIYVRGKSLTWCRATHQKRKRAAGLSHSWCCVKKLEHSEKIHTDSKENQNSNFLRSGHHNCSFVFLPRWGQAAGLLPGSAPPWGYLEGNGHSAAASIASMIQRGRRWKEPDHRWSPAGTTGSLIHLQKGRQKALSEQWTRLLWEKNTGADRTWLPWQDRMCLFRRRRTKGRRCSAISDFFFFFIEEKVIENKEYLSKYSNFHGCRAPNSRV